MTRPLVTVELFCGTKSFSKVAAMRGHRTFTVDFDPRHNPDLVADVGKLQVSDFPPEFQHPDVVWASPPCQCFSVMVIGKNWETAVGKWPIPKRPQTVEAMQLAKHAVELIQAFKPTYYFIENPRAMLRKMQFMQGIPRSTVTYCQYGLEYQKATDIWNNCIAWKPRPVCSPRSPCHVRAPRGSWNGVQGVGYQNRQRISQHPVDIKTENGWGNAAVQRAIVPPALCEEIVAACEASL